MMPDQIQENNELIAEFMGSPVDRDSIGLKRFWIRPPEKELSKWIPLRELKYHSSWDWLMPVVEKIGQTRVKSAASYNSDLMFRIEIVNGYTKIEGTGQPIFYNSSVEGSMRTATYKAVVEFIKWFNQQTQTP